MLKYSIASSALILVLAGCAISEVLAQSSSSQLAFSPVSLAYLLRQPDLHNGEMVEVSGAAVVQFENNRLCATAEELEPDKGDSPSKRPGPCVWLAAGNLAGSGAVSDSDLQKANGYYVTVLGRYDSAARGHQNCCSGALIVFRIFRHSYHGVGMPPPPPPEPSANNSFKPNTLRGSA